MKAIPGHTNYSISIEGVVVNSKNERELKNNVAKNGYLVTCLGYGKTVYIHRLIAEAFIPNPENKPCVNHKDGNKLNIAVSNLEWATYQENNIHAYRTGLKKGTQKFKKVLDSSNGITYNSLDEAAEFFKMDASTLSRQLNGKYKNKTTLKFA